MGTCLSLTGASTSIDTLDETSTLTTSFHHSDEMCVHRVPRRLFLNGSSEVASLFCLQGRKGINQDAMLLWENFSSRHDAILCGVFDGHGPNGHMVAKKVRDSFPLKLIAQWNMYPPNNNNNDDYNYHTLRKSFQEKLTAVAPTNFATLRESLINACKVMDRELKLHHQIDCSCSGTTAVIVLKLGLNLVIANVGDSRAVLGTRDLQGSLTAVQLTTDLKPNLPNVSYHRLTYRDEFVILATDGVWDVLSNKEVVNIVASTPRSKAARVLVDSAIEAWKTRLPITKVDDCTVVCLFIDSESNLRSSSTNTRNVVEYPSAESAVSTSNSVKEKEKNIKIQEFDYSDLEAATNGFSDRKLLGKGSHGYVYKAVVGGRPVAVKRPSRPHHGVVSSMTNEVDNEIDILSKIQSPRLVNLVGFTANDSRDRLLVVEFMSNGTLYDVLHSSPRPPNWGRRIRLALQTAKAIDTLHSSNPPVIHRDIKSANVLIDRSYNARLGDFGLALRGHVDDYKLRSTPPAGTMGYLDPCYVTPDNLSTKTDVFSFGILLLEIISGRKAIDITYSPPSIVDWAIPLIKKGKLLAVYDPRIPPPKDPLVRKHLAVIAAKCVRSCRERRPSMTEVVTWLCGLCKLLPLHSWNGFNINNPCMMVETVGRPVEAPRSGQFGLEGGNFEGLDRARLSKSAMSGTLSWETSEYGAQVKNTAVY
ncbi:hypothetical protein Fmac_022740 [Flemingia macrophylla]|uniref:Protein kinase domain-containing protein n=1 Tax=Flemingia macrophylla TaxID=520843 RepID=A0ABD1M170_9FABA